MRGWLGAAALAAIAGQLVCLPGLGRMSRIAEAAGPDSDTALLTFQLEILPTAGLLPIPQGGATFSIVNGSCAAVAPAPSFIDLPSDEASACGSFSGGGTFTEAGCSSGFSVGTGSATLVEPGGDAVTISGMTLLLSGAAVVLEANPATGGYIEPGSSPGNVLGFGVAAPVSGGCALGGTTIYAVTMVLTAAYVGS